MKTLLLALLDMYRTFLRPVLGPSCRFWPSCSDFAQDAIESRGALRGLGMTLARLARCHPFNPGGYDPVPKHG